MCHPTASESFTELAATQRPCAHDVPAQRCALKKRGLEVVVEHEDDALSSASTPPRSPLPDDINADDSGTWTTRKRAALGRPRVCIKSASDVRYIADLACLADEEQGGDREQTRHSVCSKCDSRDSIEETKFIDGPSPEAVVVHHLVTAVTSTSNTSSVCPILKAMVKTGARDLLKRVHERLICMGDRLSRRGKVSMLPANALLGPEVVPLLCFLQESVKRSAALIDKFQDRNLSVAAFDHIDADVALSNDQRSTAAAMLVLSTLSTPTSHP